MSEGEYHTLIKELPADERPRERLELHGARALSHTELLAIALRTGSARKNAVGLAQDLIKRFGLAGLSRASVKEMCTVKGIGPAKAAQVLAAIELGRRLMLASEEGRSQITAPEDAVAILAPRLCDLPQEELHVMILDTKHHVQRIVPIYKGNVNTAMIRVAEVFREPIKDNATAIIVAHNHPSGDPTPSPDDVRVTQELVRAGEMLDIKVLDHLILAGQRHVSLKEKGLGF